jgi:hypothetical protein
VVGSGAGRGGRARRCANPPPRLRRDGECRAKQPGSSWRTSRAAAGGASPRGSARVGSALPFIAARGAQPPNHLVRVRSERQRVEVSVARGVQFVCQVRSFARERAIRRDAAIAAARRIGDPASSALRTPPAARPIGHSGSPLMPALAAEPPEGLPGARSERAWLERSVPRWVQLRDQVGTLHRQRALWRDLAVWRCCASRARSVGSLLRSSAHAAQPARRGRTWRSATKASGPSEHRSGRGRACRSAPGEAPAPTRAVAPRGRATGARPFRRCPAASGTRLRGLGLRRGAARLCDRVASGWCLTRRWARPSGARTPRGTETASSRGA